MRFRAATSIIIRNGSPSKPCAGFNKVSTRRQRDRWVKHFEELLNRPAPLNPSDIEAAHTDPPKHVPPPTIEEIRMVTRQIRSGKATGPDNISSEVLKSDIEITANMLHTLSKKI